MLVVDTSVWIDYFRGKQTSQVSVLDRAIGAELLVLGDIVFLEVLQGVSSDVESKRIQRFFSDFERLEMVGFERALKAAQRYALLKKKGLSIRRANDMLIASSCLDENLELLHADRDFDLIAKAFPLKIRKH